MSTGAALNRRTVALVSNEHEAFSPWMPAHSAPRRTGNRENGEDYGPSSISCSRRGGREHAGI